MRSIVPSGQKPVLTLSYGTETIEIYMLNPGDVFDGFGGSRHPLTVGRDWPTGERQKKQTASIVQRRIATMGIEDLELDIYNKSFWGWMARMINSKAGHLTATAEPVDD